jgi:type II secretory ATPase GspE/PulE/Tfp pilus assembly ATPase PilB-like protein
MGVDRTAIKQINGILAQRLLTKNCPHCRVPYEFSDIEKMVLSKEDLDYIMSGTPAQSTGCSECNKGFKGRQVVAEIIPFNNEFRDFLSLQERGINEITTYLREKMEFESIWEKSLNLVRSGDVRLSELLRVFPPES